MSKYTESARKTITLSYENILEIAREEAGSPFQKETDEDKLNTITNRSLEILGAIFWTEDEAPEVEQYLARRVVYQVAETYTDAIYTGLRRVSKALDVLRGM